MIPRKRAPSLLSRLNEILKARNLWIRTYPELLLALRVRRADFIRPPRRFQRQFLLAKSLDELAEELRHLDGVSRRFVPGSPTPPVPDEWKTTKAQFERSQLVIEGHQVMQDWERPLMSAMADVVAETGGDILEVGFGMGISASCIQERGIRSHTIIESNDDVIARFHEWKKQYAGRTIRLIEGRWQDVLEQLGQYDGVFYDSYTSTERSRSGSPLPAGRFFPVAAGVLRSGGVLTYYTSEIDSLSRMHQRRLLEHFRSITVSVVSPLAPPEDCQYWWADSMVVVKALK